MAANSDARDGILTEFPFCAKAVSPDDDVDLTNNDGDAQPSTVYVGVAGNVAVIPAGNTTSVIFVGIPAGGIVPCKVTRVLVTGTTALSMVAVY